MAHRLIANSNIQAEAVRLGMGLLGTKAGGAKLSSTECFRLTHPHSTDLHRCLVFIHAAYTSTLEVSLVPALALRGCRYCSILAHIRPPAQFPSMAVRLRTSRRFPSASYSRCKPAATLASLEQLPTRVGWQAIYTSYTDVSPLCTCGCTCSQCKDILVRYRSWDA